MDGAKDKFAAIEDLSDAELQELHDDCRARAELTGHHLERRYGAKRSNGNHKPRARPPRTKANIRTPRHTAKS